ncbi:hypothetical protein C7H84_20250 [Burkholderia sp. Nafp2/4-1b]|nr:hypothetical protein C7H84_20250 [Burkholderia sp. Nafp2/4-1b]
MAITVMGEARWQSAYGQPAYGQPAYGLPAYGLPDGLAPPRFYAVGLTTARNTRRPRDFRARDELGYRVT